MLRLPLTHVLELAGRTPACLSLAAQPRRSPRAPSVPSLVATTLVLALLLASGAVPLATAAAQETARLVGTEQELVAAVGNASVHAVRLTDNLRLSASAWPAAPILRASDFTIDGDLQSFILDLSFIEGKIKMAPGVVFTFTQLELRNTRQRSGFEIDIFSASPNTTILYDNIVYHCFSCLPVDLLFNIMTSMVPSTLPQNITRGLSGGGNGSEGGGGGGGWCRTRPTVLAGCLDGGHVLHLRTASAALPVSGLQGVTSGGGYDLVAVNMVFACESPTSEECGNSKGYDFCVRTKIQETYDMDTTWEQLARLQQQRDTGGDSGATTAAAIGGAVGGFAVVAAVIAAATCVVALRRRRRAHAAAAAAGDSEALGKLCPGGAAAVQVVVIGPQDTEGGRGSVTPPSSGDTLHAPCAQGSPNAATGGGAAAAGAAASAAAVVATAAAATDQGWGGAKQKEGEKGEEARLVARGYPPHSGASDYTANGGGGAGGGGGGNWGAAVGAPTSQRSVRSAASAEDKGGVVVAGISIDLTVTLGTGSFGKVFRGSWQGRPVAVKVLQYGADLCRAVHNEVLLSQTLKHPNLVASLYFAQVLPGGRLGLHTGVPGGGGGGPLTASAPLSSHSAGSDAPQPPPPRPLQLCQQQQERGQGQATSPKAVAFAAATGSGTVAAVRDGAVSGRTKLPLEDLLGASGRASGAAASAAGSSGVGRHKGDGGAAGSGGDGGAACLARNSLPVSVHASVRAPHIQSPEGVGRAVRVPGKSKAAAAAAMGSAGDRSSALISSVLETAAAARPGAGTVAGCPGLARTSAPHLVGNRASLPLCDKDFSEWVELVGSSSDYDDGGGGSGGGGGGYECGGGSDASGGGDPPDVLSRWAEQRRRHAVAEGGGGTQQLVVPGAQVTANGFVVAPDAMMQGGPVPATAVRRGSATAVAAVPGGLRSDAFGLGGTTAIGGAGDTVVGGGGGDGSDVAMLPAPLSGAATYAAVGVAAAGGAAAGGATALGSPAVGAAAAAATHAALPMEALWLAAHTQPAEGSSHGFLVMELCEGGSAFGWRGARWKGAEERPDLSVLLRLALDVAYGMAYIHNLGVCHGDLKLSNVLLARSSGGGSAAAAAAGGGARDHLAGCVAKVCDFGLARVLTGERTHVSTRPYGTPTHMAPELWTKGHVSQPADVYAYGITLWELATGERPYKGLNAARILHRVLLSGGRPVLPLWLPPSYTRLVTHCWAQSPKERPSFADVVRHLEAMLAVLAAVTPSS